MSWARFGLGRPVICQDHQCGGCGCAIGKAQPAQWPEHHVHSSTLLASTLLASTLTLRPSCSSILA